MQRRAVFGAGGQLQKKPVMANPLAKIGAKNKENVAAAAPGVKPTKSVKLPPPPVKVPEPPVLTSVAGDFVDRSTASLIKKYSEVRGTQLLNFLSAF